MNKVLTRAEKLAKLQRLKSAGKAPAALLPLTYAQKRFWFLDQLDNAAGLNNIFRSHLIEGELDLTKLNQAIDLTIRKHPSLRTRFINTNDEVKQFELENVTLPFEVIRVDNEEQIAKSAERDAQTGFDLQKSLPCRFKLYQLDQKTAVLTICIHHIVADGFSVVLVENTLRHFYEHQLGEVQSEYSLSDIVNLDSQNIEKEQQYWLSTLKETDHRISLYNDYRQQNSSNNDGAYHYFSFEAELSSKIKQYCRFAGITPFSFFLSSYNVLLHKLSEQSNFIVGVPELNRNSPLSRKLVGALANTLLVPANIAKSCSLKQYLMQTNTAFYQHMAHQKLPYEKLVELINPERSLAHNPLFQVMFAYNNLVGGQGENNNDDKHAERSSLCWRNYGVKRHYSKVDMTLEVSEQSDCFTGYFEYKTALYDKNTIALWQTYFKTVIEQIISHDETQIDTLQLSSNSDDLINNGAAQQPHQQAIDILCAIEKHRHNDSNKTALTCSQTNSNFSYNELVNEYTKYTELMADNGVIKGDVVAIECHHRSLTIIAMLACIASNNTFVILDTKLPQARKEFITSDANAAFLLTDTANKFEAGLTVSSLTATSKNVNEQHNIAYIVYTSGSTGVPKGVRIPRQALSNHALSVKEFYQLSATSTVLQFSPLSFDLALEEIFPILAVGGTVVTRPGIEALSFGELEQVINEYQINLLSLPTAYLHSWLSDCVSASRNLPNCLTHVVIGTEQLSNQTVELWFSLVKLDEIQLINAYGPSEATISCTAHTVSQEDRTISVVPIGKPLPYAQLFILDNKLNPVPAGVIGELYVGGDNLAEGYQNLSDVTKQRFIIHPELNQRLYKTGDTACYNALGQIQFRGRIDNQVKFRGYRIELDEISNQLNNICGIKESVTVISSIHDDPELISYIAADSSIDIEKVEQTLLSNLPSYMVPSQFIVLNTLPLTERGKIDFKALPQPKKQLTTQSTVLPSTPMESLVYDIWQNVLKNPSICCATSFFNQGGHSLLALQVISSLKDALKKEITLKTFFEYPSIVSLSRYLTNTSLAAKQISISRKERKTHAPLTQSQSQMWILHQLDGSGASYNMPYILEFNGQLNIPLLEESINAQISRHDALKTVFNDDNGEISQYIVDIAPAPLCVYDYSDTPDAHSVAREKFNHLAKTSFDLTKSPAYRFCLFKLNADLYWLGIIVHHINFDGGSLDLLTRELCDCYFHLVNHETWRPTPISVQTIDYAYWQQTDEANVIEQAALTYWQNELTGVEQILDLPFDKIRPANRSFTGARCEFKLTSSQTAQFNQQAQKLGCSSYVLALAATTALLHEYSRQQDFAIGIPVSGRLSNQLESVLGLFINSLPIRVSPHDDLTAKSLIEQVKQSVLSGFDHQYLPLHKLMQSLDIERSASHNPLFQVFFNFMHTGGDDHYQLTEDLVLSSPKANTNTARFDLSFSLVCSKDGLTGHIEYSDELFDHETIALYCERFVSLLRAFSNLNDETLHQLEHANSQNTIKQIDVLNDTQVNWNKPDSIIKIIEQYAITTPNKIALEYGTTQISYFDLVNNVGKYATQLQSHGVQAHDLVGVYLARDEHLVITLLAILKCGACYLPLDPAYPNDRLAYIAADAQIRFIVSAKNSVAFSLSTDCRVINRQKLDVVSTCNFSVPSYTQDQQAYCIYTSGSTGKPKGVDVSQQNMINFLASMSDKPGFSTTDKLLALTPISFDISVLELFLPLFNGATVVLLNTEQSRDGHAIAARIAQSDISIMQGTPSTWRLLLDTQWQPNERLTMLVGGEALPRDLAEKLTVNQASLWNMYGPTETTVWSSCAKISQQSARISIGNPIANTRFYVLNDKLSLATYGSKGQLAIAGDGVTLGYRHKTELTDERFINIELPHPSVAGKYFTERVYLTGDVVRQRAGGDYLYLHRNDDQVKLRGYRIELGEIESAVESIDNVDTCAVTINASRAGDDQLIAHVVMTESLDESDLIQQVSKKLPDYMLPTIWVEVDKMPLTPSGKIDKKKLKLQPVSLADTYSEPQTETERAIGEIWQDVLKIDRVGRDDAFFKLGGNSIFAMQTLVRISERFGLEKMTLADLFRHQTVALLATHVESLQLSLCDDDELAALLAEFTQ